ncbi:MAG: tetratricopeptide repeat protein [Candidatus Omnitrophota bacterium]
MKKFIFTVSLIVVIGLGAYYNSMNGALFWDDEVTVVNNVFIRQPFSYVSEIFSTSYHTGAGETLNFYRPLATLSFAADYKIWKLQPFGYHLTNVILHLLNGILVFSLLYKIFGRYRFSLICACLFLVHPINSEAVNYVSNRTDLLMVFFFLSAFLSYVFYRRREKSLFLVMSVSFYVLSVLSKEMGLVLPIFLVAYEVLFFKKNKNFPALIGFILPAVFYVFLRAGTLNFLNLNILTQGAQASPYSQSIAFRALFFGKVFLTYIRLFFLPLNLHMEYDMPRLNVPVSFLGLLFLALMCFFAIRFSGRKKAVCFGQIWFVLGLLPICGIIVPINNVVSEHYLYLGSIGFFVMITAAFAALWRISPFPIRIFSAVCGILVVISFCYLTVQRNKDWRDPLAMYLEIASNTKYSFRANNNAGVEYFRRGDLYKAEEYFRRSIGIFPEYAEALNNLGVVCQRGGETSRAEDFYKKSVNSKPSYVLARKNLARIYMASGRLTEAKEQLVKALEFYPYDDETKEMLKSL